MRRPLWFARGSEKEHAPQARKSKYLHAERPVQWCFRELPSWQLVRRTDDRLQQIAKRS